MEGGILVMMACVVKRTLVLVVSNILLELVFPLIDSLLNVVRFGQASLQYEKGIEMFIIYFICFIYVSRLFGLEFEHHHFTPYYFGAGLLRYLYYHYARTYLKHAQAIIFQAAAQIWQFCQGLERKTVAMVAAFVAAVVIMVVIRLDRDRTSKRRAADNGGIKVDLSS